MTLRAAEWLLLRFHSAMFGPTEVDIVYEKVVCCLNVGRRDYDVPIALVRLAAFTWFYPACAEDRSDGEAIVRFKLTKIRITLWVKSEGDILNDDCIFASCDLRTPV